MPTNGCDAPHSRFCNAKANENTSRFQPRSWLIGGRNNPNVCRTPIANVTMSPPQIRIMVALRLASTVILSSFGARARRFYQRRPERNLRLDEIAVLLRRPGDD